MKRWIAIVLALVLVLSISACGTAGKTLKETAIATASPTDPVRTATPDEPTVAPVGDDWESQAEAIVSSVLNTLNNEHEILVADVDSYSSYMEKKDEIAAFYETVNSASANLCIEMCVFALNYTESILASDKSVDDMYDEMEDVYDLVYDDMGDEIYDGIYDGVLDDLYNDLYGGALDERPDDVEYADWSDARSNEYEQWSDTRSDTYDHWSDFRSDVYDFWSDVRSALWGDGLENALEEVKDFREDIEKMSGESTTPALPEETITDSHTTSVGNDWESQAEAEVISALNILTVEHESLIAGVDSYASYVEKQTEVVAFYEKIIATSAELCIKMCALAADYAESILLSGKSTDDIYDDLDNIYDLFYDNMGDEIYDGIYDGVLDDVYDSFYDGVLDDHPDDVEYAEWSDVHSDEYNMWSDTRSETYEHWSDFRSDVYGFWADMRGVLWSDDLEGAWDELEDFCEDVEKMYSKLASEGEASVEPKTETSTVTTTDANEDTASNASGTKGIRSEFKEAMDSYEAFFDEYVAFMKAYMDSENPISMMSEYSTMMQQYLETMDELSDIEHTELSEDEALYYAEVMLRINQKLLEVL